MKPSIVVDGEIARKCHRSLLIPKSRNLIPVQLVAEDLVIERGVPPHHRRAVVRASRPGKRSFSRVPTASGKTTLLRTLGGFIRPVRGTIRLEGGDEELTVAEQAHVVGHTNAVKSSLTVVENVGVLG